jgi:hypothetical protein
MNTVKMIVWASILALLADAVVPTIKAPDPCKGCDVTQQEGSN